MTRNFIFLLVAATIGVISPSGYEVGPFLSIEQAALSQIVTDDKRAQVFAWYNLFGSFTTAIGSLCGGTLFQGLEQTGVSPLGSYRTVVIGYAAMGLVLAFLFSRLSSTVEASRVRDPVSLSSGARRFLGLHQSSRVVFKLSALFSLDAFAGGFVLQSILAYWFYVRYNVQPGLLGSIFFGANVLAGFSALAAAKVAKRIGLVNTMVFTPFLRISY